jgi:hypothetical protein
MKVFTAVILTVIVYLFGSYMALDLNFLEWDSDIVVINSVFLGGSLIALYLSDK